MDEFCKELKPCPYVSVNTEDVSWAVKKYDDYFDFILMKNGKPDRCFQFQLPRTESRAVSESGFIKQQIHYAKEVYHQMDRIIPETAPEQYLLDRIKEMYGELAKIEQL